MAEAIVYSPAPSATEGKASSLGARFYAANCPHSSTPFGSLPAAMQSAYERAAVTFTASLTYAESEGVREALLSSMLLEAAKEARDLLMERTYGNAARSPGHNARVVLDSAIAQAEAVR